ncbi:hypothetical protein WJX81_001711 [Elliptochloris bilobata]|uniref:Uncharacterized protein n=1 Tax=Elliptochloris bilobata TaxID=381761 RepID=A0AAW1QD03_9CHLO
MCPGAAAGCQASGLAACRRSGRSAQANATAEERLERVERAREQIEYKLGLQMQARRAEDLARRSALERAVEGVQTRLDLKLTEERANLQAAQAVGLPADQVGRIEQMISQLQTATEELARQRAVAEAQLGQREIADEAEMLARQEVLAERAKAMEAAAAAAKGTVSA